MFKLIIIVSAMLAASNIPLSAKVLNHTDDKTNDSYNYRSQYKYPIEDEFGKINSVNDGSDEELFYLNQKNLKDELSRNDVLFFQRFFSIDDNTTASLVIGDGVNNHGSPDTYSFTKYINGEKDSVTTFSTGLRYQNFSNAQFYNNRYLLKREKFIYNKEFEESTLIELETGKRLFSNLLSEWTSLENDQLLWAKKEWFRRSSLPPFTFIAVNNYEVFPYFHELNEYNNRLDHAKELKDKQFFLRVSPIESPAPDTLEFTGYLFNRYYDFNNPAEEQRFEEDKKDLTLTQVRIEGISKLGKICDLKHGLLPGTIKVTTTLLPEEYERRDSIGMIWKSEESTDRKLFYKEQLTLKTPEERLNALRHHRYFKIDNETTVSVFHTPETSDIITLKYQKNQKPVKATFVFPGFESFQNYYEQGQYFYHSIYKSFDNRYIWFNHANNQSPNGFLIDLKTQKKILNYSSNNYAVYNDQLIHFTIGNPKQGKKRSPWLTLNVNNYSVFPRFQEIASDGSPMNSELYHEWLPYFILSGDVTYNKTNGLEFYGWIADRDYDFTQKSERDALNLFTKNNKRKHVQITGLDKLSSLYNPVIGLTKDVISVKIKDMENDRPGAASWDYNYMAEIVKTD